VIRFRFLYRDHGLKYVNIQLLNVTKNVVVRDVYIVLLLTGCLIVSRPLVVLGMIARSRMMVGTLGMSLSIYTITSV
jgi:hypothetical protein